MNRYHYAQPHILQGRKSHGIFFRIPTTKKVQAFNTEYPQLPIKECSGSNYVKMRELQVFVPTLYH